RSAPTRRGSGSSGRIPCGTTRGSRHPDPPRAFRTGGRFRPRPPPPGTPGRRPSAPSRTMPGMTAPQHHALNYVEITVTDLEEAKRFYTEAFGWRFNDYGPRSEEHTSELQSRENLVCRLLLEKKKLERVPGA